MTEGKQLVMPEIERGVAKESTALWRWSLVDTGDLQVVWWKRAMVMNSTTPVLS